MIFSPIASQLRRGTRQADPVPECRFSRWPGGCGSREGAALGDVFAFVSGLYFRGKLTYARRFAAPPDPGTWRPVSCHYAERRLAGRGHADHARGASVVRGRGRAPRQRRLSQAAGTERQARWPVRSASSARSCCSAASHRPSTSSVLLEIFGGQLRFPVEFVGRGDMSRGGLLLRTAASGCELEYAPIAGAVLHGVRPPKLPSLRRPR